MLIRALLGHGYRQNWASPHWRRPIYVFWELGNEEKNREELALASIPMAIIGFRLESNTWTGMNDNNFEYIVFDMYVKTLLYII